MIGADDDVQSYLGWGVLSGFTAESIRTTRYVLNAVALAIAPTQLRDATPDDLQRYLEQRMAVVARTTVVNERSYIGSFYGWMHRTGRITRDPSAPLPRMRRFKSLPRPITDDRFRAVMASTDDIEMRAALALARFAGLRAREIAGLTWEDIDLVRGVMLVRMGKGGKERTVPVSGALLDYLTVLPERSGPVVAGREKFGRPADQAGGERPPRTPNSVSKACNRVLRDAGVTDTLHSLRHGFGTAAYAASGDLRAVQDLMGHSSPNSTAIYVKVAVEVLASVAEGAARMRFSEATTPVEARILELDTGRWAV